MPGVTRPLKSANPIESIHQSAFVVSEPVKNIDLSYSIKVSYKEMTQLLNEAHFRELIFPLLLFT